MNQAIVIGHVGGDPEAKQLQGGHSVANFNVATSDYVGKDRDNETNWHRIVAFNKTGEVAVKHLKKGDKVVVTGRIRNRSYENKEGQKVNVSEIVASNIEFMAKKESTNQSQSEGELPY